MVYLSVNTFLLETISFVIDKINEWNFCLVSNLWAGGVLKEPDDIFRILIVISRVEICNLQIIIFQHTVIVENPQANNTYLERVVEAGARYLMPPPPVSESISICEPKYFVLFGGPSSESAIHVSPTRVVFIFRPSLLIARWSQEKPSKLLVKVSVNAASMYFLRMIEYNSQHKGKLKFRNQLRGTKNS